MVKTNFALILKTSVKRSAKNSKFNQSIKMILEGFLL